MTTPERTVEEIVEEFYCEFSQIQFIKNEKSGNGYKTMAEWITKTLKTERQKRDEMVEALIWCSGSEDFAPEGKAREGWLKICQPLIEEALIQPNNPK